jgi:hypothetical protein
MATPSPSPGSWRRQAIVALLLFAAAGVFLGVVNASYPLERWLFFFYARCWLFIAFFSLACLATGLRLVGYMAPDAAPLGERLVFGFALGVLAFFLGMFALGMLDLYGRVTFFAWPLAMLAFGGRPAWREGRRVARHLRRFGFRLFLPRGPFEALGAAFICLSLAILYAHVITPYSVGADTHGYHLPIAEVYVSAGGIRPFLDGWYLGTYPHLASFLYTWAFLSPGSLGAHIALSTHMELVLVLATLPGVSLLARRLLGGTRVPFAAAVVFLFPGIFFDTLYTAADHVMAFWSPALALAFLRLSKKFETREGVLVGTFTAAAILTKYQGSYYFVASAVVIVGLGIWARRVRPVLMSALACFVLSSTHWLKNWIYYHDPFYPLLHDFLPSRPLHERAAEFSVGVLNPPFWKLSGTLAERLLKTLKILATFSFQPHDWEPRMAPFYGSLLTLLIPIMIVRGAPRRLWVLVAAIHVGIAVWCLTIVQDRYLEAFLPCMAAATAAMLVLLWRSGLVVRAGVLALVGVQIVWGADIYFLGRRGDSLKGAIDRIAAGHEGRYEERDRPTGALVDVGRIIPPKSKLLVHGLLYGQLGSGSQIINDTPGWQGAIFYPQIETPDAAAALWQKIGATHSVWYASRPAMVIEEIAGEPLFARTIDEYGEDLGIVAGRRFVKLTKHPKHPELAAEPTRVLWVGCGGDPSAGVYAPRTLTDGRPKPLLALAAPLAPWAVAQALGQSNAVIFRSRCPVGVDVRGLMTVDFKPMTQAGDLEIWIRTRRPVAKPDRSP